MIAVELVLAGAVLVEVVPELVAGAEGQEAEQLVRAEQVALLGRIEVLDLAAQGQERLAHGRGLGQAAVLHGRERLVQEPVRDGGRRPDVVVAELADVVDLVAERLAVRVEGGDRVEVARDHRIELGPVGGADRHGPDGLGRSDGGDGRRRVEDERRGRRRLGVPGPAWAAPGPRRRTERTGS